MNHQSNLSSQQRSVLPQVDRLKTIVKTVRYVRIEPEFYTEHRTTPIQSTLEEVEKALKGTD